MYDQRTPLPAKMSSAYSRRRRKTLERSSRRGSTDQTMSPSASTRPRALSAMSVEAACRLMAERGRFPAGDLALDGNARQAAADVVVQIGGDAHAHALEGEQARDAVPVRGERRPGSPRRQRRGPEPPPLRHRRQDLRTPRRPARAREPGTGDGSHLKAVAPGREMRVAGDALGARLAPVVHTREPVLIPQALAGREREREEANRDAALGRRERQPGDRAVAELGHDASIAIRVDARDQRRRHARRAAQARGIEARDPGDGPEPEVPAARGERAPHLVLRQPLGGRVSPACGRSPDRPRRCRWSFQGRSGRSRPRPCT